MPSRIQALSSHVVNKIAAGEVIERPASVVKELLENSVDACASRIDVDIEEGGIELIRIVDDGEGIHPADMPLAVTTHATSKLRDADDLFRVQTLGFRGEALASVAEVSRLRIRSRTAEESQGCELVVDYGDVGEVSPCGAPLGTQIEVVKLFANTPVRRKFLKTTSTEFGHISEQFTRVALANPRLHMVLRHNGRVVYEVPATEKLLERIQLFYGEDLASQLIWVEAEQSGHRLWGYVGHPSQSKATRKGQWLYLNGRWIQDRALQHALAEAYRGLIMVGRQPFCFLFLEIPADSVDVNVHPTKVEVRFRDASLLYRLVLSTVRRKFQGMNLDSQLKIPGGIPQLATSEQQHQSQLDFVQWAEKQAASWSPDQPPTWTPERIAPTATLAPFTVVPAPGSSDTAESDDWGPAPWETAASSVPVEPVGLVPPEKPQVAPPAGVAADVLEQITHDLPRVSPDAPVANSLPTGPTLRAMQIHDAYLVVETDDGMIVVDQHALHERIMYEHLRERILKGGVESQRLLIPETVEVTASEAVAVADYAEVLEQFGLKVEPFGGQTVMISSCPVLFARQDPGRILKEVLEQIATIGRAPSRRDLIDHLLHTMSCKAAIKAGQRLSPEEIDSLLAQRHLVDDAHHCPHGRPTALVLSRAELDRQFGRLG